MGFFGKSTKELLALAMSTGGALLLCTLVVRAVVRAGPGTEEVAQGSGGEGPKEAAEAATVEVEAAAAAEAVPTSHVNEIVAGKVSKALEAAVAKEKQEEVSTS